MFCEHVFGDFLLVIGLPVHRDYSEGLGDEMDSNSPRFIMAENDIQDVTLTPFQRNCASPNLFRRVRKIPTSDYC